jgi:hypothetical protein
MNLLKFKFAFIFSTLFCFNFTLGKEKLSLQEQFNAYRWDLANSNNPPPYSDVTKLIQLHKANWISEMSESNINSVEKTDQDVAELLHIYLGKFMKAAFIDQYGILADEKNPLVAGTSPEISKELTIKLRELKNESLKVLLWAKDNYPDELFSAFDNLQIYDSLIAETNPLDSFFHIGTDGHYELLNERTCFSKNKFALVILVNSGLADQKQFIPCDEPKNESPIAFDCFPSGSFFRNTLENTKKNQSYFFAEGTSKGELSVPDQTYNPDAQKTSSKSCVFLGGSWSLDKQDPTKIAKGSKVKILTPDNQTKILLTDDLTALRKKWTDERTRFQLEQATTILCKTNRKLKCGL